MNVFTSAGSSTGAAGASGGGPADAVAGPAGPRPGAGFGGSGDRIAVQMPSPETSSSPKTRRPAVVTCQPPGECATGTARPPSDAPHSEQNFAPGDTLVPHWEQKRAGIRRDNIGG